jgi:hypothetical protein
MIKIINIQISNFLKSKLHLYFSDEDLIFLAIIHYFILLILSFFLFPLPKMLYFPITNFFTLTSFLIIKYPFHLPILFISLKIQLTSNNSILSPQ